jgi:hypothetical protein
VFHCADVIVNTKVNDVENFDRYCQDLRNAKIKVFLQFCNCNITDRLTWARAALKNFVGNAVQNDNYKSLSEYEYLLSATFAVVIEC